MAFAMVRAGIEPAMIHAFRKTGLIVTRENKDNLLPEDLAAWNAALDEYDAKSTRTPAWAVGMRKLTVGVYLDGENLHISNEELCEALDVPYTRENARIVEEGTLAAVKRMFPGIETATIEHRDDRLQLE